MQIISLRRNPEFKDKAITYFQESWPNVYPLIYQDCIENSLHSSGPLPQWYLSKKGEEIIGCAGLITNDFISRMDLYPWICALYLDPKFRGQNLGAKLIDYVKEDAKRLGFKLIYLCTDHIGYYEKLGFSYIGDGYHPWGESSRIYQLKIN